MDANEGDTIKVTTEKACQGSLEDDAYTEDLFTVSPNPTYGVFEIEVPDDAGDISVSMYTLDSQLLSTSVHSASTGKIRMNIEDYANGLYLVKTSTDTATSLTKIIKQ